MDEFEYLSALVAVVTGLSLTRGLSGFAKMLDPNNGIRLSGVHAAWSLSIIFWLVAFWWFTFELKSVDDWHFALLLFVLLYAAIIYFLVTLLYPAQRESNIDLLENFIAGRRPFFVAFIALGVVNLADSLIKAEFYSLPGGVSLAAWLMNSFMIGVGVMGALTANKMIHRFLAYSWLAYSTSFHFIMTATL